MQIISINVNGIRSAIKKGLFDWLLKQNADIICLQETRANPELLRDEAYHLPGYHCYYACAEKSGYSGVGIFSRKKPTKVKSALGFALSDNEGRYIHLEFGEFVVASVYFPSGTSGNLRQDLKYQFMSDYGKILKQCLKTKHSKIICGDWNIAHQPIDLKNWKANQKNSGFLPQERQWLTDLFEEKGMVDAFREVNQEPEQYTWWSNRGRAWEKNVGWRIDYQILTPTLKGTVKSAQIYKDQRFSDHAPLIIDYELTI